MSHADRDARDASDTKTAVIRLQTRKPPALWLSANRAGYALLSDIFARLSKAPDETFKEHGSDAAAAGQLLSNSFTPDSSLDIAECSIDERLAPGASDGVDL